MRLDDISWMLLEHLQRDARASYRELAEAVGLTPPAVAERMLDDWENWLPKFKKVMPVDYRRALTELQAEQQKAKSAA